MSLSYAPDSWPAAAAPSSPSAPRLLGRELRRAQGDGEDAAQTAEQGLQWALKRNCSLSPSQLLGVYLALCMLSIGIGVGFFAVGVPAVLPFAGIELLAVGTAFWSYARHAADREEITLEQGELRVDHHFGGCVHTACFRAEWVRIEPARSGASLVELTGQDQRVCVGRYLRPEMRSALARELLMALRHQHALRPSDELQMER